MTGIPESLLNRTHCMDNCEGLMLLPRECIDLVVTSPPYDDLRTYGGHAWDFHGVAWNLARVIKPGGVIVWVVADQTANHSESGSSMAQALHFKALGLNLHDTMIYASNKPPMNDRRFHQEWEYMLVFSKGPVKTFNPIEEDAINAGKSRNNITYRCKNGELKATHGKVFKQKKVIGNVWRLNSGHDQDDLVGHPAQFPLKLAEMHIYAWSNKGDVVLDPFMGSGTTAKAARNLGRDFVGFEINPEYAEMCQARVAQDVLSV